MSVELGSADAPGYAECRIAGGLLGIGLLSHGPPRQLRATVSAPEGGSFMAKRLRGTGGVVAVSSGPSQKVNDAAT